MNLVSQGSRASSQRSSFCSSDGSELASSKKKPKSKNIKFYNKIDDIQKPIVIKKTDKPVTKTEPFIVKSSINESILKPPPTVASTIKPTTNKTKDWELKAYCAKCSKKIIELFKCDVHGILNKQKDLIFKANFSDGRDQGRLIRKYPNSQNNWYSACKKLKSKACDPKDCDYAHNEIEKLIWNHMLGNKLKNLYELIEPEKLSSNSSIKSETKLKVIAKVTHSTSELIQEMPDEKFNFKNLFNNYCRICNIPFENNKNAFLQHRLQKSHLELQKLVRQFQFTRRMPPDIPKLKKENIKICPELEKNSCKFKAKSPTDNLCQNPHHVLEVSDWNKWFDYYNEQKVKEINQNTLKLSDYLIVNQMAKLKQALFYYANEKYEQPWYLLQIKGLNELNYEAMMHGMIYNEMKSCIALVEKISWSCTIYKDQLLFKIKLIAKFTEKDHLFYNDKNLIDYVNIIRIEMNDSDDTIDLPIHEKMFSDIKLEEEKEINVIVKAFTNQPEYEKLLKLSLTNSTTKSRLVIDRSMFYSMHFAVDNANKTFLFPPRIECSNTKIEEALDSDYKFVKQITPEQRQIILRILKIKSGLIALPMIIFGAFGSGKTYCIAEAVRILALKKEDSNNKRLKILICTKSECAANIYFKLWDPQTRNKALKLVRDERFCEDNNEYQTVCIVPLNKDIIKKISEASIIVCTFYTSILMNEDSRIAEWLTHILIDEAAQALECETIMPLTLALSNTTVILAGDHRQISPVIYSRENYTFFGSNLSLLQRLFAYYAIIEKTISKSSIDINDFKLMLTKIHRTVGQIVEFISHNFYNGTLKSNRKSVQINDSTIKYFPIQFLDSENESSSCEEYDARHSSFVNKVEANAICWYIEMLIKYWPAEWSDISIGLVSSEAAQVELLRNCCQNNEVLKKYFNTNKIQVDLVQNFQGWQFRVVLISSVRTKSLEINSNENLLYSLLINPYSMNTCLTRSEELLVVFGNRNFLINVPDLFLPYRMSIMWRNLISLCIHNNSYYKIKLCLDKLEDSFSFKRLKIYMDKLYFESKNRKKPLPEPLQEPQPVLISQGTYFYKQEIKDSILNTIAIHQDDYMNNENDLNSIGSYSDDDDLPMSRKQNQQKTQIIPYKKQDNNIKYHQKELRERRKRKLYSQYDALDSDDDSVNVLDDDIDIEELENYMNMADHDQNDLNNKKISFLNQTNPYYVTLTKREADAYLDKHPEKYKLCKIRFENNSFTAMARSIDNENDFYYIRDRCNCGMAYNGDTVVIEILNDLEVEQSLFNSKQSRARVIYIWKRNEKFRNREFICLPDNYEPCLMLKPLDIMYPKIFIFGTRESRVNNKITIYNVDEDNQIKTSKYHAIKMHDLESNMFKVRIVNWNAFYKYPIGIVTEVLNSAKTSEDGIKCLKLQFNIDDTYVPDELVEEKAKDNSIHRRLDFSDLLTFTIDPVDSQDFDDALSFEHFFYEDNSYYKIGIHIADVSEYVKKASNVDIEAEKRTMSYYYSHNHIPMLPRILANNFCSLNPNESKKCMSVMFIMNEIGEIVSLNNILQTNFQGKYFITKSTIQSNYRFTYEEVEFYLSDIKKHEISDQLKILYGLSQKLKKKRYEDGQFFIEENSFDKLDFNMELVAHESHSLIEEFMILTNSIVAEFLCEKYEFVPLRIQKTPDADLLTDWFEQYKHLKSVSFGVSRYISCLRDSINISNDTETEVNLKSLSVIKTIFDKLIQLSSDLSNNNSNKDERNVLMKKLKTLICNEQCVPIIANAINEIREILDPAEYVCVSAKNKMENFTHFSMNVQSYTHFTSPIRRYLDLIVHRMVDAALTQQNSSSFPYTKGYLQDICQQISIKARNQRDFERKIKLLSITELFKTSPIECVSFIYAIEERQFNVIHPYFNNLRTKKCSKILYSLLDPSKQPRTGTVCQKSIKNVQFDDDGLVAKYFESVDLEFSKRIYDIQAKPDILKLIDDTENRPIVKINLNNCYLNRFHIEHWNHIREIIKMGSCSDLAHYLSRHSSNCFVDENQAKTFLDVSSEVIGRKFKLEMENFQQADQTICKTKTIKHFNRRFTKNYKRGDALKMQMSYSTDRGFLVPNIQLISVTNTIDFCVQHRIDPVKCFSYKANRPIKKTDDTYSNFDEYLSIWLPIMSMEAATTAILEPEDVAFIRNCKIEWSKEETCDPITKQYSEVIFGKLKLDKKYCDERHLKFCEDSENSLVSKMKETPRGHPTFALSYLCVQYKNIPMEEFQKRIFSSKTGNILMNYDYTWVGHCVVTRVIDEEVKAKNNKKFKTNEINNYVIHIALIQTDIDIPKNLFDNPSLECTIELISKQYPDSSMEYALRNLHNQEYKVSKLAEAIILGTKKPKLEQSEIIYENEIKEFIENCIKKSEDRIQKPNIKQLAAIHRAFKHPFSLIQGPPGTGKTVTGIVLANCFTQLNRKTFGGDKSRLMYCSPSNKAVDVIGRFLKNRFFLDKYKSNRHVDFSFVRVYSERIASSEYPHPKYFDKIISSSPKRGENNKQPEYKGNSSDDNNHSDPELVDFVLHHIIRKDGKKYAEELKKYDKKFSILREYEDRVRNRTCCCASEISQFKKYNHRTCNHARYFYHVNKDFSMHSMLRREDKPLSKTLKDYDFKFYFLNLYLKRLYYQMYELSEIEKSLLRPFARTKFDLTENDIVSKSMYQTILQEFIPLLNQNIRIDDLENFLNSLTIDFSPDRLYRMMAFDTNVRHARQQKLLFDQNFEAFQKNDYISSEYYRYLVSQYGQMNNENLFRREMKSVKSSLESANENAYFRFMKKAAEFTWNLVNEFEEVILKAELDLFEKEINTALNSNDPDSYNHTLHEAYELELREHDIVLCTCIATSTSVLSKNRNFKQLIIDEAGMTKEPEALVPILLCNPEKVVLIGDHAQLRPIIKSQQARELGLDQSIFERYCQKVTMLEEQYRMHDSICFFPSNQFYNGRLVTKTQNYGSALYWPGKYLMNHNENLKSEMRVVFIDVKGNESKLAVHSNEGSENSVRNKEEIDCVEQIYKYLADDRTKQSLVESKDIVILSQYRAQVAGIKSRLKITNENNVLTVNIKTLKPIYYKFFNISHNKVITSQGGEWDYVILSTVRSLPDCDIDQKPTDGWRKKYLGFISDKNQVNVALTRAKRGLIIIGNKNLLKCDPIWKRFLSYLEDKKSILTIKQYFEFQKEEHYP